MQECARADLLHLSVPLNSIELFPNGCVMVLWLQPTCLQERA
jgi:hypothetical protein